MGFVRGHRKLGGRRKGSLPGQQLAHAILTDEKYLAQLRRRMIDDQPSPEIEKMLWAYAWGQPLYPNVLRRITPRPPSPDGET